jgi:NADH dehydrogenase (ubiquinone) 1 alpha/beta subcomplex 1
MDVVKSFHKIEPSKVSAEATFTDLGLDSLDAVELVMAIEEEFDVTISDVNSEKINCVNDAVEYITTEPHAT